MRLTQRLLLGALLVIGFLTAFIVSVVDRQLRARLGEDADEFIASEARLVRDLWSRVGTAASTADSLADAVGRALGRRVTLIATDGTVVGDSEFDGAGLAALENHAARPEVAEALAGGMGHARRPSPSTGDEELYVALPAADAGVARVSMPTKQIDAVVRAARRNVLLGSALALASALGIAWVFSRSVSRPVEALRDVARDIAAGDLERRPSRGGPGEVGELAQAIDTLAEQLTARLRTLEADQRLLLQLETVRRDFVANVSHELRTPLTIAGGFAETLVADDVPPAERRQFAERILGTTRRMQRIVEDLLDLSRIESGGWVPNPEPIALASLAGEVIASARDAADRKGLTLSFDAGAHATAVNADPTALRQVLGNLVDNAIRHTARGSVTIFTRRYDREIAIGVRDTGTGIPAEHLPRIFERFYRVDPARSRAEGGTGLGLAIVKHLVEAHGGRVTAHSVPGTGTTILARFPAD